MSSSASSSSHSQRTPLHQRTNSENNKQQIRLVPYTPPKIDDEAESATPELESAGSNVVVYPSKDRISGGATSLGRDTFIGSALSSASSSSSTWVKGKGVSEPRLVSESSGSEHPAPPTRAFLRTSHGSSIRQVNAPTPSPTPTKPRSRRNTIISVNPDGTFSLVRPTNTKVSNGSESTVKSRHYSSTSYSTHGGASVDTRTDDHNTSLFSSVAERSVSPPSPSASTTPTKSNDGPVASSPWNYHMSGGLRKVPQTPESKSKGKGKEIVAEQSQATATGTASYHSSALAPKSSFTTESSDSTSGGTANYKVIGRSSPPQPSSASNSIDLSSSASTSNYRVLGQSSAPQSFASSPVRGQSVLDTPGSKNFIVHGSQYPTSEQALPETPGSRNFIVHSQSRVPSSQTSYDSFRQHSPEQYSQESLVIPPLRPHKRSSSENLSLKRPSRDVQHGRSTSFSSIYSILTQETGPNVVRLAHTPSASSTSSARQAPWAGRSSGTKSRMDVHQWSSQLSPVMSEYEGSSLMTASGSRNIQSISSSMFDSLEPPRIMSHSHSRSSSLDQPGAVLMRGARELPSPPVRTIRDHDEHGDGLADLQQMHQLQSKSSRTRLGLLSRHSSGRSSHSTTSSRAGSFSNTPIPTWAKVYYGSGERRWLASPSIISEGGYSPPPSSWAPAGSPALQQLGQDIHNPRRRPRDAQYDEPSTFSPEASPALSGDIRRGPKKKTSSIWSPHLHQDRRFSHYTLWQPPSGTWSAENRVFGRRNIQLVLFVSGFIFPFAWMIAAVLPLPPKPQFDIPELKKSTSQFQMPDDHGLGSLYRRVAPIDDMRYQSARWWRNLNRYMSIIGLLILGAIAGLIVAGVRQGWGK